MNTRLKYINITNDGFIDKVNLLMIQYLNLGHLLCTGFSFENFTYLLQEEKRGKITHLGNLRIVIF